ncbi:hypothetical protein [Pseudomonas sp. zfem003]|uniref:hypothetical protein n=1 Tax=Pseudomonas sp. zfem003 TaxID=3078198 RepID=UPI0029295552|nr:hypothetical protein [Pseudomonas sp. zfem003]MDU9398059.1 hypothetical protein [Pseudomonas sp. zfem003]
MAEVNKDLLRNLALEWIAASEKVDTTDDDDDFLEFNAVDEVWQVEASGDTVLALLDENAAQAARIAELERDKVRLESEAMYGAASYREALEEIQRLKSQLNTERGLHMVECNKAVRLHNELEACRKDAGYWRYFRDRMAEPGDDVHLVFVEWCWAEASIEDVEAAIDAAMQEGGV